MLLTTKRFLAVLLLLPLLFASHSAVPVRESSRTTPLTQEQTVESKELADRALILRAYLAKYNSPLQNHAQDFIDAADTYDMDWRLVPAITGVESTFGKHIPGGHNPATTSYNGWGWGVYGTQVKKFSSWREGIFTVAGGLKKNYISKGLTNPYLMNKVYAASPTWGTKVDHFLQDINKFAIQYSEANPELVASQPKPTPSPTPDSEALATAYIPETTAAPTDVAKTFNLTDYVHTATAMIWAQPKFDPNAIKENPELLAVNYSDIEKKTAAISARVAFK